MSVMRELADRIHAHLKRFENDPKINKYTDSKYGNLRPYYGASCVYTRGAKMWVTYISYQNSTPLSKDQAERYVAKLDNGFVGRHFDALKEKP